MSVIINLYPPVIDTYQVATIGPKGLVTNPALRVYFSISDYNDEEELIASNTQVTIVDQESNLSILNKTNYPSQIMLKTMYKDNTRTVNPYYIDINWEDGNFELDKFYKVQIRLTSTDADTASTAIPQALDTWLNENLNYFSEWSRVTLIKYISPNTLYINNTAMSADDENPSSFDMPISNVLLTGELKFDTLGKEYLNSYRIYLKDNNNNLLTDSGDLFTDKNSNNKNAFEYKLKYGITAGSTYHLEVNYQTNSLYSLTTYATINAIGNAGTDQNFTISARENLEDGEITIRISRTSQISFTGDITIKRSSDASNFTIWEDMHTEHLTKATSVLRDWVDQTVESGVLYKYALLEKYDNTSYLKTYDKILMVVLDDMYLNIANQQLKIKFNPQISSFKQIINEGKIETIGSPYPYIRRNAAINYAQFPISGLISCQMDDNEKFITKVDLYGGQAMLTEYEKFNTREEYDPFVITVDNDFVYEKKFRDAVKTFLMNGNVKLFRSATEGNYLVKLTDISFTPNQQLGRMVWTFSATANEIAENTVDNYKKYNIL